MGRPAVEKTLFERVKEAKKEREGKDIAIIPYEPRYQSAFKALNEEWITAHWEMEEPDHKALDHPQEYILDKGGHIFIALYRDEPVGVCALCKKDDPEHEYELAKLAVSPGVRGKGIGVLLCRTVIGKAQELGCKKSFWKATRFCARPYGSTENWGSRKFRKAIRPTKGSIFKWNW